MKVHIEGFGVPGCLLAHLLERHGVPFTWSDNNSLRTAWRASTGAIYPSGSTKFGPDEECRAIWAAWHKDYRFSKYTEEAAWIYSTKAQPHGGKFPTQTFECSPLRMSAARSYHFNAQDFVEHTRWRYERSRVACGVDERPTGDGDFLVRAHGFGRRLGYAYWGWTRLVELEHDHPISQRPAFYFREGRAGMFYAYPKPGTKLWYAGSSIIKQKRDKMKSLEILPKYERWKREFTRIAGGTVRVVGEHDMIEGWRPAAAEADGDWLQTEKLPSGGTVVELRPLWNSGIRHFPKQWSELAPLLGISTPPSEVVRG